jgi:hypothetical protein
MKRLASEIPTSPGNAAAAKASAFERKLHRADLFGAKTTGTRVACRKLCK